jgi:hypothetical protein
MSHPINDEMFDKAFEAGIERGYLAALKDVMEFLPSPNSMIPVISVLKFIEQKLTRKDSTHE